MINCKCMLKFTKHYISKLLVSQYFSRERHLSNWLFHDNNVPYIIAPLKNDCATVCYFRKPLTRIPILYVLNRAGNNLWNAFLCLTSQCRIDNALKKQKSIKDMISYFVHEHWVGVAGLFLKPIKTCVLSTWNRGWAVLPFFHNATVWEQILFSVSWLSL